MHSQSAAASTASTVSAWVAKHETVTPFSTSFYTASLGVMSGILIALIFQSKREDDDQTRWARYLRMQRLLAVISLAFGEIWSLAKLEAGITASFPGGADQKAVSTWAMWLGLPVELAVILGLMAIVSPFLMAAVTERNARLKERAHYLWHLIHEIEADIAAQTVPGTIYVIPINGTPPLFRT